VVRDEVWDYVREHELPYNSLYDKGYLDRLRALHAAHKKARTCVGRWWWETNAPKECGIHCAIETGGLEHELRLDRGRQ
jgi:3'-phosphoadenosine 5'-phosphosulfate sulfotransferase (PAPS reductase)/FAD synthetase